MGGDGGVIAVKKQYMHGGGTSDPDAIKNDKKSVRDTQCLRSRACALSGEALVSPIVACELGHLYNKESILQALLDKSLKSEFGHVRTLKDVKEVIFESASTSNENEKESKCRWMCPLTGLEFNGIVPFLLLWSSGKVISDKGYREMGVEALQEEYGPFTTDDVVKLLPLERELAKQQENMAARREKRQSKKKKKQKDAGEDAQPKSKKARVVGAGASVGAGAGLGTKSIVSAVISDTTARQKDAIYGGLFHKERKPDKNDVFINLA